MVESNIHYPLDSTLLWDGVRVLTRIMLRAHDKSGEPYLPEVARRSRPTPMPTARGPHSKETAGSLTCEHPWPSTMLVRVPSGRQPIIDLSRYSSILMGGGIGVGRLARQVRGK